MTYSPLGKAFEKQIKTIEDQGEKQVEALKTFKSDNEKLTIEDMIPKSALNNDEAKKELDKIFETGKTIDREKLIYKASEYIYSFRNFRTIRMFGRDIYEGKITVKEADEDQSNLLNELGTLIIKKDRKMIRKKEKKKLFLKTCITFFEARERLLDGFESEIFPIKYKGLGPSNTDQSKLKKLTPKQMLQRLPTALAQVKAGNNSESLLNEIRQIVYSLYQSK